MTGPLYPYDIETYPNLFSLTIMSQETGDMWIFEISDRRDDTALLVQFLYWLRDTGARMVGFNNVGFDYPVVHFILMHHNLGVNVADIYEFAMNIIATPFNRRFDNHVKPWEVIIPQVDLYLIHHFDNAARSTSLKALEFKMHSETIQDLPFPVGTHLTSEQIDIVLQYNAWDVNQTNKFLGHTMELLQFRDELSITYDQDFTNYNDTKIGKQYFIMELESDRPGICYNKVSGRKIMNQTPRDSINLADVVFNYIQFQRPEFQRILDFFKNQTITETVGVFKDLTCDVYGLTYHFGVGGMHASVEAQTVISDDDYILLDLDVMSYYPSLAIANNAYPEHLGEQFCNIYSHLLEQRKQHPKGSAPNKMLKLALNGVYGDSNSKWSPFYDPQYTMTITINGQLLLCMLAEALLPIRDLDIIQMNTDGVTIKCPREELAQVRAACDWWQRVTFLTLEEVEYDRMFIRDVNNYIAVDVHGKRKRKGAYEYELDWAKDHSARVVAMAAEHALLNGEHPRDFIHSHKDHFDFMSCTKVPRNSHLLWGEEQVQNTTRYYISTDGRYLTKLMPPLASSDKTEFRTFAVKKGHTVTVCNDMKDFNPSTIDYEWYIEEAMKLVRVLR